MRREADDRSGSGSYRLYHIAGIAKPNQLDHTHAMNAQKRLLKVRQKLPLWSELIFMMTTYDARTWARMHVGSDSDIIKHRNNKQHRSFEWGLIPHVQISRRAHRSIYDNKWSDHGKHFNFSSNEGNWVLRHDKASVSKQAVSQQMLISALRPRRSATEPAIIISAA